MPPTLEQLAAKIEALEAQLVEAQTPKLPDVVPLWGVRTCQECGAEATVIDVRPETRAVVRNGEGYCPLHAVELGIVNVEHLQRRTRKS